MSNVFEITKESSIMIYGALNIGVSLLKVLQTSGFHVRGFIDRRADEIIEVFNVPVCHPDKFAVTNDTIVIITTKNVFEHASIVNHLLSKGITNLIFYPFSHGKVESQEFLRIESSYNHIINSRYSGTLPDLNKINPVPKTTHKIFPHITFNKHITKLDKDTYILKVPVEFVFTEILDELNNKISVNILALPHINLFNYFSGYEDTAINRYVDYNKHTMEKQGFAITNKWRTSNFEARFQVFSKLQKQFILNRNFFINNAQDAEWDDENHFFIVNGGRHRISFLISKGYEYIPLKIKKASLDKFQKQAPAIKLINYLKENENEILSTPLPHPSFYEYPAKRPEYFNLVIKKVLLFIYDYFYLNDGFTYDAKNVILISRNYFSLIRFFYRIGYNCFLTNEFNLKELLINQLINIDSSKFLQNVTYNGMSYDIIYISIEYQHKIKDVIKNAFFTLLFLETTDPLFVKKTASSRYLQYKQLGLDFLNGDPITLGVIYHE